MKLLPSLIAAFVAMTSLTVAAQWQWLDHDGRKVFSDRAPPPDIPEKNVLKRPGAKLAAAAASAPVNDAPPAPTAVGNTNASTSGIDKELEAKKKAQADAEASKRKAEEDRYAKAKSDNCARAKQAKATFDSGIRMARVNAQGEREIMDDAARDAEQKRLQAVIDSDCR